MGAWNCWNSLDLRKKARKSKCWLLKVTKRTRGHFQNWTSAIWTSFLPVTSIKGMSAAVLWHHCAHALFRATEFCEESSQKSLDYGRDQALFCWIHVKQFWVRGRRCSRESRRALKRKYIVVCMECCAIMNWERQQEKECLCCKEIEDAVNKISGEY